ncbi:MAG: helix-turn-helix domain-containing protein [Oscillospiraceae bacterium]|nr:helix-turn-helix domain-containing protein [Oscillospiraceae bacterium]
MQRWDPWITEDGLTKIQGWARDGLIDKQIAHNMGVSPTTIREWKKRFPEIAEALRKGKEVVDREVENALLKSALGFMQKIRKPVKIKEVEYDPKNGRKIRESEKWVQVEEEIFVPPQVTAQIFWLKNRKPDEWREKNDLTLTPSNGVLESLMELHKNGGGKVES